MNLEERSTDVLSARRNVTQLARVDTALGASILESHRVARDQIQRSEKLHDLFFREMPEYPDFAWQEAIVNAFAHRDYEDQGREIEVWFYEDRMEVKSPGDLMPSVTIEQLLERKPVHASRNPMLVRVLVDAGFMREEGEGIPRMFEEMEESLLHVPTLVVEASEFKVTLRNDPVFEGASDEWQQAVKSLNLAPNHRRVLLAHPRGFTNEDYRRLNDVDRDQATKRRDQRGLQDVVFVDAQRGQAGVAAAGGLRISRTRRRTPLRAVPPQGKLVWRVRWLHCGPCN